MSVASAGTAFGTAWGPCTSWLHWGNAALEWLHEDVTACQEFMVKRRSGTFAQSVGTVAGSGLVATIVFWSLGGSSPRERLSWKKVTHVALTALNPPSQQTPRQAQRATNDGSCFRLRTACGRRTAPHTPAPLEVSGEEPADLEVGAASIAGLKGLNQDCLAARSRGVGFSQVGLAVDGHGPEGHFCAKRLCSRLPELLDEASHARDVPGAIRHAFDEAEADLESFAKLDNFGVEFSGAAAAAVVLRPDEGLAYLAACGDAQAIIVDTARGVYHVNEPHKAHVSSEGDRIRAAGGLISQTKRGQETFSRVYPPNKTFGLAMSRCFGDLCVKPHGVINEPDVQTVNLSAPGTCCVLGSDGLFEFCRPAEIVEELQKQLPTLGAQGCAEVLVDGARQRWGKAGGNYCDDISCLILANRKAVPSAAPWDLLG